MPKVNVLKTNTQKEPVTFLLPSDSCSENAYQARLLDERFRNAKLTEARKELVLCVYLLKSYGGALFGAIKLTFCVLKTHAVLFCSFTSSSLLQCHVTYSKDVIKTDFEYFLAVTGLTVHWGDTPKVEFFLFFCALFLIP